MKILQKSEIKEADRQTILMEPISSLELMERAANACFHWILQHYSTSQKFCLLCGSGNNGGDGLALYRMLCEKNIPVHYLNINWEWILLRITV